MQYEVLMQNLRCCGAGLEFVVQPPNSMPVVVVRPVNLGDSYPQKVVLAEPVTPVGNAVRRCDDLTTTHERDILEEMQQRRNKLKTTSKKG